MTPLFDPAGCHFACPVYGSKRVICLPENKTAFIFFNVTPVHGKVPRRRDMPGCLAGMMPHMCVSRSTLFERSKQELLF
jgi:hypothetical protein